MTEDDEMKKESVKEKEKKREKNYSDYLINVNVLHVSS